MPPTVDISAQFSNLGKAINASGLGDDLSNAADAAGAEISNTLGGIGILPDDVKAAAAAFKNLPSGATNAVLHMATTGQVSLTTVAPILAMGLAATGIGAPAAAIVAAALPIVDSIGHALGLFGSSQKPHHDWTVGRLGFVGKVPYGPSDSYWKTSDKFFPPTLPNSPVPKQYFSIPPNLLHVEDYYDTPWSGIPDFSAVDLAFPEYRNIECDLYDLSQGGGERFANWPKEAKDFAKAYYGAWKADAEKGINGHKMAGPSAILTAVLSGWNRGHSSDRTFTIEGKSSPLITPFLKNFYGAERGDGTYWLMSAGPRYIPHKQSLNWQDSGNFIESLLNGDYDGNRKAPIVLNIGAVLSSIPAPRAVTPSPSHLQGMLLGSKNPLASKTSYASILSRKSSMAPWLLGIAGVAAVIALKRR